jgi:hypothetical protein
MVDRLHNKDKRCLLCSESLLRALSIGQSLNRLVLRRDIVYVLPPEERIAVDDSMLFRLRRAGNYLTLKGQGDSVTKGLHVIYRPKM